MPRQRQRTKQSLSLRDRLNAFTEDARQKARRPLGPERDHLLAKARQADTACYVED